MLDDDPLVRKIGIAHNRLLLAGFLTLATALLCVGLESDYRLKHEDNNALFATIARSHLELGLGATRGHDVLFNRGSNTGQFYAHHPPGAGLILAGVMSVTGRDDPLLVRGVAVAFHLVSLGLFYRILRRTLGESEALLGALLFAILPQAAFFGRMLNHEPMVLPALLLMVDRYLAFMERGGWRRLAGTTMAAVWGALVAWLAFFVLAACSVHALLHLRWVRERARPALLTLVVTGGALFALDLAHLGWVVGWDYGELIQVLTSRTGARGDVEPLRWLSHLADVHRRYFTATGLVALIWLGSRVVRRSWEALRRGSEPDLEPAEQMAAIFLLAGLGYLLVFNAAAAKHHYWHFALLPADVIAMVLLWRRVLAWARAGGSGWRTWARRAVPVLIAAEVLISSTTTLWKRHTTDEPYCLETVAAMRRDLL